MLRSAISYSKELTLYSKNSKAEELDAAILKVHSLVLESLGFSDLKDITRLPCKSFYNNLTGSLPFLVQRLEQLIWTVDNSILNLNVTLTSLKLHKEVK